MNMNNAKSELKPVQDKPMFKVFIDNTHAELECMVGLLNQIEYRIGVLDGKNEPKPQDSVYQEPTNVHDHLSLIQDRVRNMNIKLEDINSRLAKQIG